MFVLCFINEKISSPERDRLVLSFGTHFLPQEIRTKNVLRLQQRAGRSRPNAGAGPTSAGFPRPASSVPRQQKCSRTFGAHLFRK